METNMKFYTAAVIVTLLLGACSNEADTSVDKAPEVSGPVETGPAIGTFAWAVAGDWRKDEERARDVWRHPVETLEFFGIQPDATVVEIWPGGGWYTQILAPYLRQGGGQLVTAGFDPETSERAKEAVDRFAETYVSKPETYGAIDVTILSATTPRFATDGSADAVLTFRNVHNWMSGGYEASVFEQAYTALKPGGILGIVEHRLPSGGIQDPAASTGYVHEDYVKALASAAGFEFVSSSEINANPADTADHPFGVWTLPPNNRDSDRDGNSVEDFDPATYKTIGESDRMTLKFIKPS